MRYLHGLWMIIMLTSSLLAQNNRFRSGEILLRNGIQKTGFIYSQLDLDVPRGTYFKASETEKAEYFEFTDIQEIQFSPTERYITHCTQNTAQERCHWLKQLLSGKVNLYQSPADEGLYFIEEASEFYAIREPGFAGTLTLLKRKCADFIPPADTRFSTATLIRAITHYNQCKDPNGQVQSYYAPKAAPQWHFGPKLGANRGNAYIAESPYFPRTRYQGADALTAGVVLQLQNRTRFVPQAELNFFYRNISSDTFNFAKVLEPSLQTLKIKLVYLELPLILRFEILKNKTFVPFVQGGVHTLLALRRDFYGLPLDKEAPQVKYRPPAHEFKGIGFGLSVGGGLQYQLSDNKSLYLLAHRGLMSNTLDSSLDIYPERIQEFYFKRLQVEAALLFKFKSR